MQAQLEEEDTEQCMVCLENMKRSLGEGIQLDCCGKLIHSDCLRETLLHQGNSNLPFTCPMCRRENLGVTRNELIENFDLRDEQGNPMPDEIMGGPNVEVDYGIDRRPADDGEEYTEQEFLDWYGDQLAQPDDHRFPGETVGEREWRRAGERLYGVPRGEEPAPAPRRGRRGRRRRGGTGGGMRKKSRSRRLNTRKKSRSRRLNTRKKSRSRRLNTRKKSRSRRLNTRENLEVID
jgi:hypothetical protein